MPRRSLRRLTHARAASDNLKLLAKTIHLSPGLNSNKHCFVPFDVNRATLLQLDVLRSLAQIQLVSMWTTSVLCERTILDDGSFDRGDEK